MQAEIFFCEPTSQSEAFKCRIDMVPSTLTGVVVVHERKIRATNYLPPHHPDSESEIFKCPAHLNKFQSED